MEKKERKRVRKCRGRKKEKLGALSVIVSNVGGFAQGAKDAINGDRSFKPALAEKLSMIIFDTAGLSNEIKLARSRIGGRVRASSVHRVLDLLEEVRKAAGDSIDPDTLPQQVCDNSRWIEEDAAQYIRVINKKWGSLSQFFEAPAAS